MQVYVNSSFYSLKNFDELNVVRAQYQFNQTIQQQFALDADDDCEVQGNLQFTFLTGGLTPSGDGTLTCSAVGDLDGGLPGEAYTINFEGSDLSPLLGGNVPNQCDPVPVTQIYNIPLASMQTAAGDGTIFVTAIPGTSLDCFCGDDPGESNNQVTCTLEFPA
jgi:type II secretory pathway pseudopilin PulG